MQRTQLIGHLGQDAEVKEISGNHVMNFTLAVTENWKDSNGNKQSKTTWYDVSKWGKSTAVAQYLKKGTQVFIEGRPEARAYLNKTGEAIAVNGVNAQTITLLGGNTSGGQ